MAIISSFFGEQTPPAGVGGFAVGAEIPEELKPYYTDIMSKAQALYGQRTAAGYQPYTGPSLAPFAPEQEQAFTGLQGLVGGVAPKFAEAEELTRGAAAPITGEQIEEYMSPYQQAVVDIEKREAQKQFETGVVPQLAQQAAQAQAFGGSRQGILEGMAADTQQRLLADIQAKGSAQAYQDAVKRLEAERSRSGQAGAQLATMAPQQFKTQLGELGAVQTVGEERQKQTQAALNEAYRQFIKEQQYPYETMGKYQSVITGAPLAQTQYIQPQAQPSMTQQLLGGLGTMVGTYGAFGGFSPGGLFGRNAKTGGGIADLPVVYRQNSGGIGTWISEKNKQLLEAMNWRKALDRLKAGAAIDEGMDWGGPNVEGQQYEQKFDSPSLKDNIMSGRKHQLGEPYSFTSYNYLENIPEVQQEPTYFRDPSGNPIWQEDDSGLFSVLKGKASDMYKNIKGKGADWWNLGREEAAESLRPREVDPLYAERPPIHADIEGIDRRPPFQHDIDTTKKVLVEASGEVLDVAEVAANYGIDALNYLRDAGSRYFLGKPSTDIPSLEDDTLRGVYNIPPDLEGGLADIAITPHGTTEKGILSYIEGKLEGVDENIKEFTNKHSENIRNILTKNTRIDPSKPLKEYINELSGVLTDTSRMHNAVDGITGADNPEDFVLKLQNNTLDSDQVDAVLDVIPNKKVIKKDTKILKDSVKNTDKIITLNKKKLGKNETTYQDALDASEDAPDNKKKKSKLDTAYDDYIAALETYNDSLSDKKTLINSAEKESFFAFLAQVSSRYGAGENLIAAAGKELPNAMKTRQKFIQARSDLDDKMDQGVVKIAKAELDIEKDKTAAVIAAEKEQRERYEFNVSEINKMNIAIMKDKSKDKYFKGNLEDTRTFIKTNFSYLNSQVENASSNAKKRLIESTNITGINDGNFDLAWESFIGEIKPDDIFTNLKNDPNHEGLNPSDLVSKHLLALWKRSTGKLERRVWVHPLRWLPGESLKISDLKF